MCTTDDIFSAMDFVNKGNQLFVEEQYQESCDQYSKAIAKLLGHEQFPALFGRARTFMLLDQHNGKVIGSFRSLQPLPMLSLSLSASLSRCPSVVSLHPTIRRYSRSRKLRRSPSQTPTLKLLSRVRTLSLSFRGVLPNGASCTVSAECA